MGMDQRYRDNCAPGLNTMETQDSALIQVRRASRSISILYNLVLSSCGLAATQYILLQSIAGTEVSQMQLWEQLSVASTTLSRRLSGLRKKGLVQGRPNFPNHHSRFRT
jgi:DNA-binding MarR family transcriptional regulator